MNTFRPTQRQIEAIKQFRDALKGSYEPLIDIFAYTRDFDKLEIFDDFTVKHLNPMVRWSDEMLKKYGNDANEPSAE